MHPGPLVLIGLPAAGKSTLGRLVAAALKRPFIDLDDLIEERAQRPIPDIFSQQGERGFRALESEALTVALAADPAPVVATGGGVVVAERNRLLLIGDESLVVWLDVPNAVLLERLDGQIERPLLEDDPALRLIQLRRQRLAHYTTCADAIVIDNGEVPAESLAENIVELVRHQPRDGLIIERVELGDNRSYPVVIGRRAIRQLPELLPPRVRRAAIVTQAGVGVEVDPGIEHQVFVVADGEEAKRLEVVGELASQFAQWGLTRHDAVISVGGGVVSDLAGYVAASYHRGVPVVHVSTTLLGQIDAAIGGKCGVNLPEGKNLLGAFKQPAAVVCDTATLATLPPAEFSSGMGELAKYHFLGGGQLDRLALRERVAACVRIKADVVAEDETESGRRAILNYGHTLAHSLEAASRYQLRHGEAVAVGLLYAAELAAELGRIDRDHVEEHRRVIDAYGLEPSIPAGLDPDEIVEGFSRDKKAVDGITFVLDGPEGIEPVIVGDKTLLRSLLDRVS